MGRRGRARQVAHDIARDVEWLDHVMFDEGEAGILQQHRRIGARPRMIVVEPHDLLAVGEESHRQVGAEEAGRACDEVTSWGLIRLCRQPIKANGNSATSSQESPGRCANIVRSGGAFGLGASSSCWRACRCETASPASFALDCPASVLQNIFNANVLQAAQAFGRPILGNPEICIHG